LATLADLVGAPIPPDTDGISFLPTLLGQDSEQEEHDFLYWEYHEGHGGTQAIRQGDWKALRKDIRTKPEPPVELYNLADDVGETTDLAALHPDLAEQMLELMQNARTTSAFPEWNFPPEWEDDPE
jgi:arylsulfatase A-like enzyme